MAASQFPCRRNALTAFVYFSAAVADSWFWVTQQRGEMSLLPFLEWLCFFAIPLLFMLAYPRILFSVSGPQTKRYRSAVILHGVGTLVTTILFAVLATPFWKNPVRGLDDSIGLMFVFIVASTIFLVSALTALFRNTSSLAVFASFVFWPYILLLALVFVGRFFEVTAFRAAMCFLCLIVCILFAFSAGAVFYRPRVAHITALAGFLSVPWLYWTMKDSGFGNVWLTFNIADKRFGMYSPLGATLTILSVGLIGLAIVTAVLRMVPSRWQFRRRPICERSWPAFAASFLFLTVWFSQSVMPYRLPGAIDVSGWPVLQILHVQKRGFQFHETCVRIWGYRRHPFSVSFSSNDRRLFQYRFQQTYASGQEWAEPLAQRVQAIIQTAETANQTWDRVTPVRAWNDDGWYVVGEGIGLKAYSSEKGTSPPHEIVALFNDLERIPRSRETQSELRDVCLGFCYDPLSGLGSLYANQRCRNDGKSVVCR